MIDAIIEQNQWDELILFSGDSDFEKLIKQIISMNKKAHIFCFGSRISHELIILTRETNLVTYTKLERLKMILERPK